MCEQFQEFLSLRGVGRSNPKTAGQDILKVLTAMQSRAEVPFSYALQDMADNMRHMVPYYYCCIYSNFRSFN